MLFPFKSSSKEVHSSEDDISYVVCTKCDSMYEYKDCLVNRANDRNKSKECSHVPYPKHPFRNKRKPCGNVLLKTIKTKSGHYLKPRKVYPYLPLSKSLSRLLNRKEFLLMNGGILELLRNTVYVMFMMVKYGMH